MIVKRQKAKVYLLEQKEKIVKLFLEEGLSYGDFAKKYDVAIGSVKSWVHKYKKGVLHISKRDLPKEKSTDYKQMYEILKKYNAFLKKTREKK